MTRPFKPELSQNETATTTSGRIALGNFPNILLIGEGAVTVYVKFGGPTVEATNEDIPILSGMALLFTKPDGVEHMAFLAASSTSRLGIVQGSQGS